MRVIADKVMPTFQDLVKDADGYEKNDKLNFLLSQEPPAEWVKLHPIIKVKNEAGIYVGMPYLPIDKVEFLLRRIFKEYKIEITGQGTSFNGVYVTVRVHYRNFITNEWAFHDGIGASQLQTKKDTSPTDMININNGAISMAFPLAKTLAIKDACDMFGKLFGADVNRRDTLGASMQKKARTDFESMKTEIEDLIFSSTLEIADVEAINDILVSNNTKRFEEVLKVVKKNQIKIDENE